MILNEILANFMKDVRKPTSIEIKEQKKIKNVAPRIKYTVVMLILGV